MTSHSKEYAHTCRGKGRQAELYMTAVSGGTRHAEACTALTSMLGTRKTNPSDISSLHTLYTHAPAERPPVELMQHPAFLDILVQVIFTVMCMLAHVHACAYAIPYERYKHAAAFIHNFFYYTSKSVPSQMTFHDSNALQHLSKQHP
jgi:hypothetical protein